MKFVVDENLPRRLVIWLRGKGHEATHVLDLRFAETSDRAIWAFAAAENATVVTRDSDFRALWQTTEAGAVVQIMIGNTSNDALLAWLDGAWPRAVAELGSGARFVELVLD